MTLKEKFDKISCSDCNMPYCEIKCTILKPSELNHLEKIANDYAIEFAKWIQFHSELWINNSTKELLEIYKKEKGL
jgi:hypothetical protein